MRGGKTEKAGEAHGLDPGIEAFQRPAQHLRTNIDAKCGLERGSAIARLRSLSCQRLRQSPLRGSLGGLLKDGVDCAIERRRKGRGMHRPHARPSLRDLGVVAQKERFFPDQPDRQEIGDRLVRAAGELGLP